MFGGIQNPSKNGIRCPLLSSGFWFLISVVLGHQGRRSDSNGNTTNLQFILKLLVARIHDVCTLLIFNSESNFRHRESNNDLGVWQVLTLFPVCICLKVDSGVVILVQNESFPHDAVNAGRSEIRAYCLCD